MKLVLSLVLSIFLVGCTDKVAYIGNGDNQCKYTEVNGELKTCKELDNSYERIWVDSCLVPLKEGETKINTTLCLKGN